MGREGRIYLKSQVTMFVIVAIVLLFIFSFLIFIANAIQKSQLNSQAEKQIQQYLDQNSINQYVTSCLNVVADRAIVSTSMQGGITNFTDMAYGKDYIVYFDDIQNRSYNISVSIIPQYNCTLIPTIAPDFPYPKTDIVPGGDLYMLYGGHPDTCKYDPDFYFRASGFYGYNQLKRLCNWNGTNKVGATESRYGHLTCIPLTYTVSGANRTSVQEELELLISQEVQACVDFSKLPTASNITVENAPKAAVTFGVNGMKATLTYPFKVKIGNRQPVTQLIDFAISKPVPFKELYDYVFTSAYLDVTYGDFNMQTNLTGDPDLAYYYRGYQIERIKDAVNHIDIVRYKDNHTLIDNKPLVYQIAIENRRPALEYMHYVSGIPDIDIFAGENETITLTPQGYDPDEDWLVYNYSGWKEDYDEYYNHAATGCGDPPNVRYVLDHCMVRIYNSPRNWSNSPLFLITGQNASYTTNASDVGIHLVNISIREGQRDRLRDWQEIIIYVFALPEANAYGYNLYDNVSNAYGSLEDVYFLSGVNSTIGLSGIVDENDFSYFEWNDTEFHFREYIVTDDNKTLKIPEKLNGTFNMTTIRPFVWNYSLGFHNITLLINTTIGLTDEDYVEMYVARCLPHRNPFNLNYPYNVDPFDAFDSLNADHTCCIDFNYAGAGMNCYTNVTYGSIYNFIDDYFWNRQPSPPNPINIQYPNGGPSWPRDNDIFMRTFERNCSGIRGNVCTGNAVETRGIMQSCRDDNYGTPNQERCVGPPVPNPNSYLGPFNTSADLLQCQTYFGSAYYTNSFEKIANGNGGSYVGADGTCNYLPACGNAYGGIYESWASYARCTEFTCSRTTYNAGKCSTPVASSCICSTSNCGAPLLCDGVALTAQPDLHQCTSYKPYIADRCSYCRVSDRLDNICRSSSYDVSCTAAESCNGIQMGTGINGYQYCSNACQVVNCTPYGYNYTSNSCYSGTCQYDYECALEAGYDCCDPTDVANGRCSNAQLNSCFQPIV